MTDDVADGRSPTHIQTGIYTLVVDTGKTQWTVRVDGTLRFAAHIGITHVTRDAGADSPVFHHVAVGVWTTWGWVAGVRWGRYWLFRNNDVSTTLLFKTEQ